MKDENVVITRTKEGHIVGAYTFKAFLQRTGLDASQFEHLKEHGYCQNQEGREILMEDVCQKLDRSDWAFPEELVFSTTALEQLERRLLKSP